MTIAVTGATGQLGRLVIEKLKHKAPAAGIVALARSAQKAADLGVEVRIAPYGEPAALEAALPGVDTLLLISGNEVGQRRQQHANVIAAAKKNGVQRIVYTSVLRADRSPLFVAPEHRETEAALKASGVPYTILRNGWYHENYNFQITAALAHGALPGASGDGRISAASRSDYADAAEVVLTTPGHENKIYELAGDSAFTRTELAAELSRQTGRHIPYRNLPEAEYAAVLKGAGVPEFFAAALAASDAATAIGALFDDGHQLSQLIGHPTTPLAQSVKQALA